MRIPPVAPLAILLLLAACSAGHDWPSLARRPAESAPPPAAATVDSAPLPSANPSSATPAVASGRLVEAARDFAAIDKRWQGQKTATEAAVAAAGGAAADSPAAAKAQLELSRWERVGAQIGDLRARLDAISGDLAVAAAGGGDVAGQVRDIGALIVKVEALRGRHKAAFDAAQAAARK